MTERPRTSSAWLERAQPHVWQPYTQMQGAAPPIAIERAEGAYFYTTDGRKILDGISSWWVNIHGHSHPRLNAALARQAERMAHVMFAGFTHEPGARLAEELVRRVPGNLPHVFFSDDGSTSVEVALKMVYQHWRYRGQPERRLFVAVENSYHGDTFGAMAVSDVGAFHAEFRDLLFDVRFVDGPHSARPPEARQSLEALLAAESDRVAGVIIEPMVQGAGGMIVWPPEYLRSVRKLTRQSGVPLIADEVFTGFGRTGRMFACEHGPIEPDVVCVSKGLTGGYMPLAATIASDEIYAAFLADDRARAFFHGHSYTGNPLGCAVALESLALFDDEDRLARIRRLEGIFAERRARLEPHPLVRSTRGLGGIAVLELEPDSAAGYFDSRGQRLCERLLADGIFLRPLGNIVYLVPPYVITDDEARWCFDRVEAGLDAIG